MKLVIEPKKKALFISLFQQLKLFTKTLCIFFHEDYIYIQGMDSSHICLYESKFAGSWFRHYEKNQSDHGMICLDPNIVSSILAMAEDGYFIEFFYENEPGSLDIHICKENGENGEKAEKGWNYDKHFSIPLIEYECELMSIPENDYDIQFILPSKKICELTSQLSIFGDELKIHCAESSGEIVLGTVGDSGEMKVNIHMDDVSEFTISEGGVFDALFSLNYVHKYCLTSKLTSDIQFSLMNNFPMRIRYQLDDNFIMFFIAPKVED